MKRFLNILCVLCALAAIICLSATTVFAAEDDILVTQIDMTLGELVPGQPLPIPQVAEDAPYSFTYHWYKYIVPDRTLGSWIPATTCEENGRYLLDMSFQCKEGYTTETGDFYITVDGEKSWRAHSHRAGSVSLDRTISLKETLPEVRFDMVQPMAGMPYTAAQPVSREPEKYTCSVTVTAVNTVAVDNPGYFVNDGTYWMEVMITPTEAYEFSQVSTKAYVNDELQELKSSYWYALELSKIYISYRGKVGSVEFPAWPETVQPGPGGMKELTVPEGAGYRLAQGWMDLRTGQTVETLLAGNVYTLAYVAIPEGGFRFTEETVFTLGGEACEPMGDEQYMVLYKTYDLGATKIDRVEITTPKFTKGYAPGNVTVTADAPYTVMETLWAESTTGKFDDAEMVEGPSYNTGIYAIPVLAAKDGYAFAEDVKLFINGQEVTVEYCNPMVNVIELAGYAGTLTPPTTNGWHREDNTWAFYRNGEKVKKTWMKDSTGWVYLDENGLMVQNGFAKDSHGTCYLGADGYMVKNRWVKHEGGWYFVNASGYLVTNRWLRDSRDWCYVGADGKMYTNAWVRDSVGWCYVGEDGYMVRNAWAADSQGICRLGADGYMLKSRWVNDGEGWAYVDSNGYAVANGWIHDGKGWCYINGYYMVSNVWAKDSKGICRLGPDGYMITSRWVHDGQGWAYVNQHGYAVFNQFVKDSYGTCYIGSGGYMLKNQYVTVDGVRYWVNSNGYVVK